MTWKSMVLSLGATLALTGCGLLGGVESTTPVEVLLTEQSLAATTADLMDGISVLQAEAITGVFLTFDTVALVPADAGDGVPVSDDGIVTIDVIDADGNPMTVDLLAYTDTAATIATGAATAGVYEQIRLMISSEACFTTAEPSAFPDPLSNVCADTSETASFTTTPITVPSGLQTGMKVNLEPALELGSDAVSLLLLFDAEQSVVDAGATGKFLLQPTVETCEAVESASVWSCVEPADPAP